MTNQVVIDPEEQNQDAYDDLIVSIEASVGNLNLLIAVCDYPRFRDEIIARYENELTPNFHCYHVTLARGEPSLKAAINELVQQEAYLRDLQPAVITVTGIEQLYFLKFGEEQSEQEKFFGYLQWTREALREFPFAIVIWVTNQLLLNLMKKAPDFWSWRNGVFHFVCKPSNVINAKDIKKMRSVFENTELASVDDSKYSGLPIKDLQRLIEQIEQQSGEKDPKLASLYSQLGDIYFRRLNQGEAQDYNKEQDLAIEYYSKAIALQRALNLEADLADSLNNLALLYDSQGRYSEAEQKYLQAFELRKRLLGEEHPDVAASINNLAALYKSQGRYSEAEQKYLQALELTKRLLGEEHPDVATIINNLAELYRSQERYSETEPLYLQALELRKRLLGEEHPSVATSINNLALLYHSQGRYSEAEQKYLQALELYKRLLGEEHPYVATIINNLAALYDSQERYSEAEQKYLQALELTKRLLGEEHPDVAISINNLALLYNSQGRYSEAEQKYLQALELTKRLLGEEHPNTATVRENLENCLAQKQQNARSS